MKIQKEILSLTTLRFVGAFYVFLFHINMRWPLADITSIAGRILVHGAIGMSLFFVLSGFVLAYRFNDGIENIYSYAFMRFSRIYPVYLIAAISTLPWLISTFSNLPAAPGYLVGRYAYIIFANILLVQAWMPQLFSYWNDSASWSISVEAFFYALFPFVLEPMRKLSNRSLYITIAIFLLATSLPGISYFLFPNPPETTIFYAIPIFRLAEFLCGLACGLLYSRGIRIRFPTLATTVSMAMLGTFLVYGPQLWVVTLNWIVVPTVAVLIFSFASLNKGILFQLATSRPFVSLGHISYSFYSIQTLIIYLCIDHHDKLISYFPQLSSNWKFFLFAFITLTIMASISFYILEVNLRDYMNKIWRKKNNRLSASKNISDTAT